MLHLTLDAIETYLLEREGNVVSSPQHPFNKVMRE